jgi:hypothetical protein
MNDQRLSNRLLQSIRPVDWESSDTIVIFNQGHSKYILKLYTLLSIELSKMGIFSVFLYRDDLLLPYYPDFIVNDNKPCWNAKALNDYLKRGNDNIKAIAEIIIN